jgi:hypothetical protein
MAKLDIIVQLAAADLVAMSQSGRPLDESAYQEVYERYNIREDQLELVYNLLDVEIMRRIPGFSDELFEGPQRRS